MDRLWPVLEKQLQWFLDRRTSRGLVHAREFYLHFDNPIAYHECEGATLNAMVFGALKDAAYLAGKTARRAQAARYSEAADALAEAYNEHLWDEANGTYYAGLKEGEKKLLTRWPDKSFERYFASLDQLGHNFPATPQAAVMALYEGLVPPSRLASVRKYLLERHGEFISPVSYLFAFHAMYEMNTDEADQVALDTMRRRWAVMVDRKMPGTLGEQFGDESYYCHDFGPIPAAFLAGRVLGVRRVGPIGAKRIAIEPRLGDLTTAEGVVVTRHGPVRVAWNRVADGRLRFEVSVPEGVTARLSVPVRSPEATLTIDGRVSQDAKVCGRYLTTTLQPGKHQGSVTP